MDYERLFLLAEPYLKKNDLGILHTRRVFNIAKKNFEIPSEKEELVYCSIILHDIGGSSIKKQYEEGSKIATLLLGQLDYDEKFIHQVCEIIRTHHDHPGNPSIAFQVLYDSDRLVMFSPEEFPYYNSNPNFDWNKIIDLIYSEHAKDLAKELLKEEELKVNGPSRMQNELCGSGLQ